MPNVVILLKEKQTLSQRERLRATFKKLAEQIQQEHLPLNTIAFELLMISLQLFDISDI